MWLSGVGEGGREERKLVKVVREQSQKAFWSMGKASDFMLSNLGAIGGF